MLFLLNDSVLDIGDPETCLLDMVGVIGLRHERLSAQDVREMARQVYFRAGRGQEPAEPVRRALAALIALHIDADAALFVVPPNARGPEDVQARFASASLPLITSMYAAQGAGGLTPRVINEKVWNAAR